MNKIAIILLICTSIVSCAKKTEFEDTNTNADKTTNVDTHDLNFSYKGMKGFKVYYVQLRVSGGSGYVPESMPDNNKWFFYTWDTERREYVRVEEIEE
jgi:hypothetical protein